VFSAAAVACGWLAALAPPAETAPARAGQQSVTVEQGNVVLVAGKTRRTLTHLGRDSESVLSPDGAWVLYTRAARPVSDAEEYEDCTARTAPDELRRIKTDGSGDEVLLRGQAGDAPEQALCGFHGKQFTSDGGTLYFLSPAWTTSSALHAFDMASRATRFVLPANDLLVLSWCTSDDLRDALVVQQHRYFRFGGGFDWYWLFERGGGKEVGPVGELESAEAVRSELDASGQCSP
jgi:hypothetical protein